MTDGGTGMLMYGELAPWFHLLTHPADYEGEADDARRLLTGAAAGEARTLLELGSGGGNNASWLKRHFTCTLTDLSPAMLAVSRSLNPECEHLEGDMRTLRLGRTFDCVFVHDAVMYITTEEDLAATAATAFVHTRPGGAVLFLPDHVRETFTPATEHGGHDAPDGRCLRYLEWDHEPAPGGTTFEVDYAIFVREPGQPTRIFHDRHTCGLFPRATWERVLTGAGFELVPGATASDYRPEEIFLCRRPPER
jgi:SAM-dependent methyltransferase